MRTFLSRSMFVLVFGFTISAFSGCESKPETTVVEQPVQSAEEAAAAAAAYEESMK